MTPRHDMEKALKKAGWPELESRPGHYFKPGNFRGCYELEHAYRLMSTRQAARERRRLKAAGWIYNRYFTNPWWVDGERITFHGCKTRQEALEHLNRGEKR